MARGDPDLVENLATLDAYVAAFDENGITSATTATRLCVAASWPYASPDKALKGSRTKPARCHAGATED
jgi:hypothetical protein